MSSRHLSFLVAERMLTILLACLIFAAGEEFVIRQTVSADDGDKFAATNSNARLMKPEIEKPKKARFYDALKKALAERGTTTLEKLYDSANAVERRILEDYGAIFLVSEKVLAPPVCMFTNAAAVDDFQIKAGIAATEIAGAKIELQPAALRALLDARDEALRNDLDITPRDGAEAARRSFADTVRLWNSRFKPALAHWQTRGRLTEADAVRLASMPVNKQVREVLQLEEQGLFFNTFFNNSILYSVAAPGASQHLSLLAFDANEFADKRVREILARHGWFRTVKGDAPHFTYLGADENMLPLLGLKKIKTDDGEYWIPNVD
jgi:hypothetical protein